MRSRGNVLLRLAMKSFWEPFKATIFQRSVFTRLRKLYMSLEKSRIWSSLGLNGTPVEERIKAISDFHSTTAAFVFSGDIAICDMKRYPIVVYVKGRYCGHSLLNIPKTADTLLLLCRWNLISILDDRVFMKQLWVFADTCRDSTFVENVRNGVLGTRSVHSSLKIFLKNINLKHKVELSNRRLNFREKLCTILSWTNHRLNFEYLYSSLNMVTIKVAPEMWLHTSDTTLTFFQFHEWRNCNGIFLSHFIAAWYTMKYTKGTLLWGTYKPQNVCLKKYMYVKDFEFILWECWTQSISKILQSNSFTAERSVWCNIWGKETENLKTNIHFMRLSKRGKVNEKELSVLNSPQRS